MFLAFPTLICNIDLNTVPLSEPGLGTISTEIFDTSKSQKDFINMQRTLNKRPKGTLITHLSTINTSVLDLSDFMTAASVKSVGKASKRPKCLISSTLQEYHRQSCNVFLYMKITQNEFRLNTLPHKPIQCEKMIK